MNSTTTCALSAPVDFQGNTPLLPTDIWNFSTSICTTTNDISTNGGFTYGDLTVSFLLFALLVTASYGFFYHWIRGYRIRV